MKTIASLEPGQANDLLTSLKNTQISAEVRSTRHASGLETTEILVADEDFQRGSNLVETWYTEQRVLKKNQLSIRVVVMGFLCAGAAMLFSVLLGMMIFLLMMDCALGYVIWRALRTGVIHSKPLAEWTDEVEKFKNPFGFWMRVGLCILMWALFSSFLFVGVTHL